MLNADVDGVVVGVAVVDEDGDTSVDVSDVRDGVHSRMHLCVKLQLA